MKLKALVVLVALGAIALAFVPIDYHDDALLRALFDAGHFPLLALITIAAFLVATLLPLPHQWRLSAAVVAAIGVAIAIEVIQPAFGRSASREDIRVGLLGVLAGSAAIELWHRRQWLLRALYIAVILVAAGVSLRPAYKEWQAKRWQKNRYPLLASFEESLELRVWHIHGTREVTGTIAISSARATHGRRSLEVRTPARAWNSVGYSIGHRNWSDARAFALDIFVTDQLSRIQVVLQDRSSRKLERWLTLRPGWNNARISLTELRERAGAETPDLRKMRYLTLSVPKSDPAHVYYVDNVRVIVDTAEGK